MKNTHEITINDLNTAFEKAFENLKIGISFQKMKFQNLSEIFDIALKCYINFKNKDLLLKLFFPFDSKTRLFPVYKSYIEKELRIFMKYNVKENTLFIDDSNFNADYISFAEFHEKEMQEKKDNKKEISKDQEFFKKQLEKLDEKQVACLLQALSSYYKEKNIVVKSYNLDEYDEDNLNNIDEARKSLAIEKAKQKINEKENKKK